VWHPFVAISVVVGRGAGFRETYRIAAYQSLPYMAGNLIPLLGFLVAVGGMSYLGVFGVMGAHGTATTRDHLRVITLVLTFLLSVGTLIVAVMIMSNTST
jgi:hypothetical protein